jgi:hypothetical protein
MGTDWELIENLMGTHWEQKNPTPSPYLKRKKPWAPWICAVSPHGLQDFF